jgi:hypothetical protein
MVKLAASGICHSDHHLDDGVIPLPWAPVLGGILGPYAVGLLIAGGVAFQWNFYFFAAFALLAMLLMLGLGRHPDRAEERVRVS